MAVLFSEQIIQHRVKQLAAELTDLLKDEPDPVFLIILTGAFVFGADLIRAYDGPCEVKFVTASSYKDGKKPLTDVQLHQVTPLESLAGKTVVVLDDIYDSGATMIAVAQAAREYGAKKVFTCALLYKVRPNQQAYVNLTGFAVPDEFVVGYGMGAGDHFRQLSYIARIDDAG